MRLGEIKNIIGSVLNDSNNIVIDSTPVYGNQAYNINNYILLIEALEILSEQSWNDTDYTAVEKLKENYGEEDIAVQIEASEFNGLNSYVSNINSKLPLYFSILETMVDKQDEQIINIKLSESDINSLDDLNKLNKRLSTILKLYNIDGEFEFKGFDKGSSWYMILAIGTQTYAVFIACLKLAQEYFKTKEQYYKSKKAELDYKTALKISSKEKDFSQKGLNEFIEERLKLEVEEKVKEALEEMKIDNGSSGPELKSKIIKATEGLIKELGNNTEFHLSLNPPEYAEEISGGLKIDYKKFAEIRERNNEIKELGSGDEDVEDEINSNNDIEN